MYNLVADPRIFDLALVVRIRNESIATRHFQRLVATIENPLIAKIVACFAGLKWKNSLDLRRVISAVLMMC